MVLPYSAFPPALHLVAVSSLYLCFSQFNVQLNHLGILLNGEFELKAKSGPQHSNYNKFPGDVRTKTYYLCVRCFIF